jgi:hypothetical protein
MGIRLTILSIFLVLLPQFMTASEHGMQLSLNKEVCAPGDVVELHASMERSEYAEFELKLPKIETLHLVTQQQSPISYSSGFYRQSAVWVFQPKRSGEIEWTGIRAILKNGANETEYTLPPLTLKVTPYPTAEDSLTLEPLPEDEDTAGSPRLPVWLTALCIAGILAVLYRGLRLKLTKEVQA